MARASIMDSRVDHALVRRSWAYRCEMISDHPDMSMIDEKLHDRRKRRSKNCTVDENGMVDGERNAE
jgi:hypothetical protein